MEKKLFIVVHRVIHRLSLLFKAVNGLASKNISDLTWYVPFQPLRSMDGALLVSPRSLFVTKGDWAFTN